jgi:hypothetical protein
MAASTPASMPRLSEAARHLVFPSGIVSSVWPMVQPRLEAVGTHFDPWQQGFATVALGLDERGKYAATIGGVVATIPRQVGKTFTVGSLLIGLALLFPGLRVIWTSHHLSTTKNTLQSMQGMVMRKRMRPHIRNVYTNNNDMRIAFNNGSVVMFGAREHGFGRGMDAIDVLVFDEAQKLGLKALEDMVPATNQSRNPHGALVFFIGTPPRPEDDGEAFSAKRRQALEGNPDDDMVYVEFSADRGADPMDRKQWRKANPSYPHRTPTDSMLRMRKNIPDDASWLREAMGVWDEDDVKRLVSPARWAELEVDGAPDGIRSYGVAFSFDDTRVSLGGAVKPDDGPVHVELIDSVSSRRDAGVAELVHWFCDDPVRPERWRQAAQIAICGRAGATVLFQALRERGVPAKALHLVTTVEYMTACATFLDAVRDGSLTHLAGQAPLDQSVTTAEKKPRGQDGAWGWQAASGGDETPTEAVTVALWAARTSKRRPGRKAVMSY